MFLFQLFLFSLVRRFFFFDVGSSFEASLNIDVAWFVEDDVGDFGVAGRDVDLEVHVTQHRLSDGLRSLALLLVSNLIQKLE